MTRDGSQASDKSGPRPRRLFAAVLAAVSLLGGAHAAWTQAVPAAEASPISTGFSLPTLGGSLQWAATAYGSLDWGYYNQSGVAKGIGFSGDLAYLSESKFHPFSLVFAGGRTWGFSGLPNYGFASLGMSQLVNVGRWNYTFSDYVSYLPQTSTGGGSGVVGVGDLGVPPVQVGPDAGQGVLTNYSPQISNNVAGSVQRAVTGKTTLDASGSYYILRYINGPGSSGGYGLENDTVTGSAGFSHRLDARNTYGANYAYSSYIFLKNLSNGVPEPNFVSQTVSMTYTRHLSRKLDLSLAAGPEWTSINLTQNTSTLNAYADASLSYTMELAHLGLGYVRSTNSGYGVTGGSLSDSITFNASRVYGRVWSAAANAAWTRTASLPTPNATQYDFKTLVAGFQISRALARNVSAYASYTIEDQTHASQLGTVNLFDGTNNIVGLGITYSPASRRLGRP